MLLKKNHLKKKVMACTRKGVIIHDAVNDAQIWWWSSKVKNVAKSVDTSVKPKTVLKNTNFNTALILEE